MKKAKLSTIALMALFAGVSLIGMGCENNTGPAGQDLSVPGKRPEGARSGPGASTGSGGAAAPGARPAH